MSLQEMGERLVSLCRAGKNMEAIDELYADDIVSVEAMDPPEGERTSTGIEAVKAKNTWWRENNEVHGATANGPFAHGLDRFAVHFKYDLTWKPQDQRYTMEEVAIYTVMNGKIVKEEFFYSM